MSLLLLLACLCAAARGAANASFSSNSCISPSEWDTCDWVESNSNTDDEHEVGDASYPWQCIAMVRAQYPDATIANIKDSPTTTSLPVSRDLSLEPTRKGTGSTASSTAAELVPDSRT